MDLEFFFVVEIQMVLQDKKHMDYYNNNFNKQK